MFTYVALFGKAIKTDRTQFWQQKVVYAGKNKELAFNNEKANEVQIWNDGIYEHKFILMNKEWTKI